LPEIIEEILPQARPKGAFKDRDWMRPFKTPKKFVLTSAKQDFEVASAVVYPVGAAMRWLIKANSGEFRVDPREFLEKNKQAIYNFIDSAYRDYAKKREGPCRGGPVRDGQGPWLLVDGLLHNLRDR
jgi:hypothetical protein